MIIHSHRGLGYGRKENSLAAFVAALSRSHGIELDVRLAQKNDIVISHDSIEDDQSLPSFDELAQLLTQQNLPQDAVAVHLKGEEQTEAMIGLLARKISDYALCDSLFIFNVTWQSVNAFRKINPKIRLAISVGAAHHAETIYMAADLPQFTDVPIVWWDEWGEADGRSFAGELYSKENLEELKNLGKKVYAISPDVAYQTNHPLAHDHKYVPVWKNLIRWGVDGICTDVPGELEFELVKV